MGRHFITKIRALMHQDIDVRIQHIYREANMYPNVLAREERLQ